MMNYFRIKLLINYLFDAQQMTFLAGNYSERGGTCFRSALIENTSIWFD
jgi:hypothetical protein